MTDEAKTRDNSSLPDKGAIEAGKVITAGLLKHVPAIVESCGATALFVYVDALDDPRLDLDLPVKAKVFYVSKERTDEAASECLHCLRVPDVPLTRIGRVKIAIFLALSRGLVKHKDRIVFLSGLAASKTLDTVIVTEVGREYEFFSSGMDLTDAPPKVLPEVIERVIDIASELGSEGREGKGVGAMFVVGDTDCVIPLTRQLVLNPFKGYLPSERNILDYSLEETVKELATLDGAFIVRGDGVIETCGAYVRTASQEEFELPRGLGSRHHAAAAITAVTGSLAVTVSESTGSVTIFRAGRIITEIEKPRSTGQKRMLSLIRHRKAKKTSTDS
ncbi:DNA integrity scanning protein DisA nucleotide-binding domain protein [Anaerobaca lacustris]|uniref:Diadenylate cyclase n=1 Tax=Anaerobaca lacustris TaxID=3044600 RepID=A0AAW6TTP7_9BACT|nr:diadenylate cyclase [Sedimentisphaerales bacterium M17dextr]